MAADQATAVLALETRPARAPVVATDVRIGSNLPRHQALAETEMRLLIDDEDAADSWYLEYPRTLSVDDRILREHMGFRSQVVGLAGFEPATS